MMQFLDHGIGRQTEGSARGFDDWCSYFRSIGLPEEELGDLIVPRGSCSSLATSTSLRPSWKRRTTTARCRVASPRTAPPQHQRMGGIAGDDRYRVLRPGDVAVPHHRAAQQRAVPLTSTLRAQSSGRSCPRTIRQRQKVLTIASCAKSSASSQFPVSQYPSRRNRG